MLRRMVFVLLLVSACSAPSTSGSNSNWVTCSDDSSCANGFDCVGGACMPSASGGDATTLPACTWSPTFDQTDAAANDGRCVAARALLSCTSDAGIGGDCISDDPTQCSGPNPFPVVS